MAGNKPAITRVFNFKQQPANKYDGCKRQQQFNQKKGALAPPLETKETLFKEVPK